MSPSLYAYLLLSTFLSTSFCVRVCVLWVCIRACVSVNVHVHVWVCGSEHLHACMRERVRVRECERRNKPRKPLGQKQSPKSLQESWSFYKERLQSLDFKNRPLRLWLTIPLPEGGQCGEVDTNPGTCLLWKHHQGTPWSADLRP